MDETKYKFIEGFAEGYANFGQTRLMGRIMAELLLSSKPLSLDEITAELGVSKGPVSTEARKLEMLGTVEKIVRRGSKRVFYKPVDDAFAVALARNLNLMDKNREIAANFLENAPAAEIDPAVFERVTEMEHFYTLLIDKINIFQEEWKAGQHRITPSAEHLSI